VENVRVNENANASV